MTISSRYIVLIHGLWDTPSIFKRLSICLEQEGFIVLAPHLPHELGRVPLQSLGEELDRYIEDKLGEEIVVDIVGFSMGGLISRYWLQNMSGFKRVKRFISIGSPHHGTFTAQLVPSSLFTGVSQMKRGSFFLKELNKNVNYLEKIYCISFFCWLDLMVFPGWEGVLPVGPTFALPVLTHKGLIYNPKAIEIIMRELLNCS